jgi:hypothetical protein
MTARDLLLGFYATFTIFGSLYVLANAPML